MSLPMSATAKVEIATSGTPALVQGKPGGAAQGSLSSSDSEETSFRSGWQSLLASLTSSVDETSATAANQASASAETAGKDAAGESSESVSASSDTSSSGLATLRLSQAEKDSDDAGAVASLSATDAQAVKLTAQSDAKATKSVSTKTETKPEKISTETKAKSASDSTSSSTADSAKPADLAASASLPQSAPVPVIASTVASNTEAKTLSTSTDLASSLSTGLTANSFSSYSTNAEGVSGVSLLQSHAAGRATGKESQTPSSQQS